VQSVASEVVVAQALRIHQDAIVIAGHTDICPDVAKRQRSGETGSFVARHAPVLRKGGISAVCDHVAGDAQYLIDFPFRNTLAANRLKFGLQGVEAIYREQQASPNDVSVATTVDEIVRAKAEGKVAIVICFEGASPIEDDTSLLDIYHRLSVRIIGLTHDHRNLLADGLGTGGTGGLTSLGREAVREMNRLGIVVDISHLNEAGFWDVIETSTAPIHASHSNSAALRNHRRNLSDEQLVAIAATGGVVGVHAMGAFVSEREGQPTLEEFVDHIEHMVEVMGDDHVAIGPDLMENYPDAEYALLWKSKQLPEFAFVYPDGFTSLSQLPNVTIELVRRGFSESTISKILGGNLLRLFGEIWG